MYINGIIYIVVFYNKRRSKFMSINQLVDLHNHTIWSDGKNKVDELIENVIKHNISSIGITDHYNTSKCTSISPSKLNRYINNLTKSKIQYENKINILRGIEINCLPFNDLQKVQYKDINKLDYVLLEYLECLNSSISLEDIAKLISNFKIKVGLAHTDLIKFASRYNNLEEGLREILKFLKNNNIFWKLNINSYSDHYYNFIVDSNDDIKLLKKLLKEYYIEVTVGSDTHDLLDYEFKRIEKANIFLKEYNFLNVENL